jgi:hypothetical protein
LKILPSEGAAYGDDILSNKIATVATDSRISGEFVILMEMVNIEVEMELSRDLWPYCKELHVHAQHKVFTGLLANFSAVVFESRLPLRK